MDRTPKGKSLRFVRSTDNKPTSNTTPIKEAKKQRFWEYDIDSQESNDVSWDWDSPKNIKPKAVRVKRREIYKSPKLPPKKTSQTDHMKNYEKLKQELQALRDEIARADDCLPLSPVDEQVYKEESVMSDINSFIEEQYFHYENQEIEACLKNNVKQITNECVNKSIDEMFDDDCDEQLFLCTQIIEDELNVIAPTTHKNCKVNENTTSCVNDINKNVKTISNLNSTRQEKLCRLNIVDYNNIPDDFRERGKNVPSRSIDDSFDAVLREFEDEDIDILSQATDNNTSFVPQKFQSKKSLNSSFKRTISDANVQYLHQRKEDLDVTKSVFQRTQSFESASVMKKDDLPKHIMDDIERKRKEALARLKEKKDKDRRLPIFPNNLKMDNSQIQCSQVEIEKKRLQAQAIREAKQREIIEKNRQEAIKRLEMNRRKRMESSRIQGNKNM